MQPDPSPLRTVRRRRAQRVRGTMRTVPNPEPPRDPVRSGSLPAIRQVVSYDGDYASPDAYGSRSVLRAQAGSTPTGRAGTQGRSGAESVHIAEHRVTIWCAVTDGSAEHQERRCDPRSTVTSPP